MQSCGEVPCGSCQSYLMGAGGVRGCAMRGVGCARLRRAGESESGGYMPFLAEAALPDMRDDAPPLRSSYDGKTVLDLLHSLGVDDADIRFDNFGG